LLEEIAVLTPRQSWQEARRGKLSADVAAEFPSVFVSFAEEVPEEPHIRASEWDNPKFDNWSFDVKVDRLACEPFVLRAHDDCGERTEFALEVLNRCQRAIGRRNAHSQGAMFDRVLRRHRLLHDCTKPLVRADYNHALDAWQWLLRIDADASLAVQIAALFHDIERLASEADVRIEHLAPDYQQFKDAHAKRGADMTDRQLLEAGVPEHVRERVGEIITAHERTSSDAEVQLLNDADALSWFSLNSPGYADYYGAEQTHKKLLYTWNRMRPSSRVKLRGVKLRPDVREMVAELVA
jgi:hypothetical protein